MLGNFKPCFALTETYEGWHKFSNNPNDPGGATYSGVTQAVWNAYCQRHGIPRCSVRTMTDEQCEDLYSAQYWKAIQGDKLPKGMDAVVYDEAVNSGPIAAIKALQKVLNQKQDGHLGLVTFAAIDRRNVSELIGAYDANRLSFLHRLKTWRFFGKGWGARVANVTEKAKAMVV